MLICIFQLFFLIFEQANFWIEKKKKGEKKEKRSIDQSKFTYHNHDHMIINSEAKGHVLKSEVEVGVNLGARVIYLSSLLSSNLYPSPTPTPPPSIYF